MRALGAHESICLSVTGIVVRLLSVPSTHTQVADLAQSVERLKLDKVVLEQEMEMEEENITNKLQRQVDLLLASFRLVEGKLQSRGISLAELGVAPPVIEVPGMLMLSVSLMEACPGHVGLSSEA